MQQSNSICLNNIDINNYEDYLNQSYPYPLSEFQTKAIKNIINGNNVLITAHTGSGKTLPAEFAIEYFISKGKKVIYTSPIKSLINEKYYSFTKKYPHISFGILTGDIKCNSTADVILMTAEILLNKLTQKQTIIDQNNNNTICLNSNYLFEIDIDHDLSCVVMDEVHYINDVDRGQTWENTIMLLPKHVQMLMLSATIDNPIGFAKWIESVNSSKEVAICSTNMRVVPLTNYSFITVTQSIFKKVKDKSVQEQIKQIINKPIVIQTSNGKFNDVNFNNIKQMLDMFEMNNVMIKRSFVLNELFKYLVENEMLPCLCFVLSRKELEKCAKEITVTLLEFDSKVPYIIDVECEKILRNKFPNYKEYTTLPEYVKLISLLQMGIGIHHAGMMPIFKEIVEIFYSRGYIKVLFATETFSVGINMPTRTVVFTDAMKHDGKTVRQLYSHEFSQMQGRAGRRGIDKVGHVIHLHNLFRSGSMSSIEYKRMMNGLPQALISKFKISYKMVISQIYQGMKEMSDGISVKMLCEYVSKSMSMNEIFKQINEYKEENEKLKTKKIEMDMEKIEEKEVEEYIVLLERYPKSINKERKNIIKRMKEIEDKMPNVKNDLNKIKEKKRLNEQILELEQKINNLECKIEFDLRKLLDVLSYYNLINNNNEKYVLTKKGIISFYLKDVNCIIFSKLIMDNVLSSLSTIQIAQVLSLQSDLTVQEKFKSISYEDCEDIVEISKTITEEMNELIDVECLKDVNGDSNKVLQYDLCNYVKRWCKSENEEECKMVLQMIEEDKEIFLGDFVKSLLKINNYALELEMIMEYLGDVETLIKIKEIPLKISKFVVTTQSLYI